MGGRLDFWTAHGLHAAQSFLRAAVALRAVFHDPVTSRTREARIRVRDGTGSARGDESDPTPHPSGQENRAPARPFGKEGIRPHTSGPWPTAANKRARVCVIVAGRWLSPGLSGPHNGRAKRARLLKAL